MPVDPRLTKLFAAAARVCALHDHELGEPGRADAIEILRETVNSMSPLTAERAGDDEPVAWEVMLDGDRWRAFATQSDARDYLDREGRIDEDDEVIRPLYAHPPTPAGSDAIDAAPVAWVQRIDCQVRWGNDSPGDGWSPLYPAPPNTARAVTPPSGAGETG